MNFLETERMTLRQFTVADEDNLVDLDRDPAVMRYLNGGKPTPREVIRDQILPNWLAYYDRSNRFGFWAAIEKSTGEFLGWFHFRPPDESRPGDVELGYRLRKSAWGKGYGTEGARALIRKGFTELGVERVFASTYQDNVGSRRVMEKAGLTLTRTFRPTVAELAAHGLTKIEADELWDGDDVEYALLKRDWEKKAEAGSANLPPP